MPDFGNASSSLRLDHNLSRDELIRTIRFFIAAEYEAIQMYLQVAEATDDALAKKVLEAISEEEMVHAGEFLALLKKLNPDEEKFYNKGAVEVEGEVRKDSKEKDKTPEEIKNQRLKNLFKG